MDIVTPSIGLIFWTALLFTLTLIILRSVAFKPIAKALKERENSIEEALQAADKAQADVSKLEGEIDQMKKEARAEREEILKEAQAKANKIVTDAQEQAKEEQAKVIKAAQDAIQSEKNAALAEVKQQVASISLDIAEKIIRKNLADDSSQKQLVENLIDDIKLN